MPKSSEFIIPNFVTNLYHMDILSNMFISNFGQPCMSNLICPNIHLNILIFVIFILQRCCPVKLTFYLKWSGIFLWQETSNAPSNSSTQFGFCAPHHYPIVQSSVILEHRTKIYLNCFFLGTEIPIQLYLLLLLLPQTELTVHIFHFTPTEHKTLIPGMVLAQNACLTDNAYIPTVNIFLRLLQALEPCWEF